MHILVCMHSFFAPENADEQRRNAYGKKVQADKWGVNNGESDEKAVNV